ncbi:MAG: outer membrane lipid asymmetry maintenance protein MlaD [Gammaproteobacteria bacterium]|nr:outer membrane lipid asymmetry maintenance protein MlaD [Gammaproteobacteria bacterium]
MEKYNLTEILVGLFVAAGFVALFFLAMNVSNLRESSSQNGYTLKAQFENIGGLKVRSPVTISGVRVGRVQSINLDQEEYQAAVALNINAGICIPEDSIVKILTSGLLGEQYIGLEPGGMEDCLQDHDDIELTQSAVILENLISKFLFNKAEGNDQ